jgi:hypothetical protein
MRTLLAAAAAAALTAAPAAAQVVRGRVLTVDGDAAVGGAMVRLVPEQGADSAVDRADTLGRFRLEAPGAGAYRVVAERLGFRDAVSREFQLDETDSLEVLVRLSADTVVLNPVQVVATSRGRPARIEGFYRRAEARGFGWFLTRDQIERRPSIRATELLWRAPGIRVGRGRTLDGVVRGRDGCIATVYVDGMRINAREVDVFVMPGDLEGIEVYTGSAAPVEYGMSSCALVLLWTRG